MHYNILVSTYTDALVQGAPCSADTLGHSHSAAGSIYLPYSCWDIHDSWRPLAVFWQHILLC